MLEPAERLSATREYYFSNKLRELETLRAKGRDIINLGIGNPDLLPSAETLAVLHQEINSADANGYQSYKGIPELRQAMADWYGRTYSVRLDAATEVLPLMGSKEGILYASLAYLNPGDEVLIPDPGYPTYRAVTKMIGAVPRDFPLIPERNCQPDLEALEKLDLRKVKMMWLNYPNMPTGTAAGETLFEEIIDFGRRHSILICHDNPYSTILTEQPVSILSVDRAKATALELNSLSKSHNMAGWRIGMAVSSPEIIQNILTIKSNADSGMYKPLQLAAIQAFKNSEAWHRAHNETYRRRQRVAMALLDELGCSYSLPQMGLFVWAGIPTNFDNSETYSDYLLERCGIFLCPGSIFGQQGRKYIRLSLCNSIDLLGESRHRVQHLRKVKYD